jgi:hypothetical protein
MAWLLLGESREAVGVGAALAREVPTPEGTATGVVAAGAAEALLVSIRMERPWGGSRKGV